MFRSSCSTPAPRSLIYLSRGIWGGGIEEQHTGLWEALTVKWYNEKLLQKLGEELAKAIPDVASSEKDYREVKVFPYEYGSISDVAWSLLNISHGYAYDMAYRIAFDGRLCARHDDALYLAGHSGGVQRVTIASQLLYRNNYQVRRILGMAGPTLGIGRAEDSNEDQNSFVVYIKESIIKDPDAVSVLGLGVHGLMRAVQLGPRAVAYILSGGQITNFGSFSNAEVIPIPGGFMLRHRTPATIDARSRVPFSGYLQGEYRTFFEVGEEHDGAR